MRVEGDGLEAVGYVYTALEYSFYNEFGTLKMEAQPFMRPAVKRESAEVKDMIKNHIRSELNKISAK